MLSCSAAYSLLTLREYEGAVEAAGFRDVQVHNQKEEFLAVLHRELDRLREQRQRFVEVRRLVHRNSGDWCPMNAA